MKEIACVAAIFAAVFFGVYITIDVWHECRQTNSFFYCLKLVSR